VTGDPDRGAELGEGFAQRRHRQRDADGEHDAGGRQRRAEQPVPPVPLLPLVTAAVLLAAALLLAAARCVPAADQVSQEPAVRRRMLAGVGRA
jgi:hypothetical protein